MAGAKRAATRPQVQGEREREGDELQRPVRQDGGDHPAAVGADGRADQDRVDGDPEDQDGVDRGQQRRAGGAAAGVAPGQPGRLGDEDGANTAASSRALLAKIAAAASRFAAALEEDVEGALAATSAEARARWTAIDRRLTDLAPVIPLANRRSVDFVSDRVGNVQHPLQWSTLLDQMWVR